MAQTADGFLWIGTMDGLVRFDGAEFRTYRHRDYPGLHADYVMSLFVSSTGRMYVGTAGGLSSYYRGEIRSETLAGLEGVGIGAIAETRDGSLWVGAPTRGLVRVSSRVAKLYTSRDGLPHNYVNALAASTTDDTLWVATPGGLAAVLNGRVTVYKGEQGLPSESIRTLMMGSNGDLWIGTGQGHVVRRTRNSFEELAKHPYGAAITGFDFDSQKNLWISTAAGYGRLKNGSEQFELAGGPGIERQDRLDVSTVFVDKEGSVWFAVLATGLLQLWDGRFTNIGKEEGLQHDLVWSIAPGIGGNVWIATNGGLSLYANGRIMAAPLPREGTRIPLSVVQGSESDVWIGGRGGTLWHIRDWLPVIYWPGAFGLTSLNLMAEDRDGLVWIASSGVALFGVKGGQITRYGIENGLPSNEIYTIAPARMGGLWIGTNGKGLVRFRDGAFRTYGAESGLKDPAVTAIYEDVDGAVWLWTPSGLFRFQGGTMRAAGGPDALPAETVCSMLEDQSGNLWFSTMRGLLRVEKAQLNKLAETQQGTVSYMQFGTGDGMRRADCTAGTAPNSFRAKDGRLWFATSKGIAIIDPASVGQHAPAPAALVTRVVHDGEELPAGSAAQIEVGGGRVEFRYSALTFQALEKVRFQYTLEGTDSEWIETGSRREATYTNLRPGKYRFRVKASNREGVWGREASVALSLVPRFYQTWWFRLLLLAAAGVALWALHRWRVLSLEHRSRRLQNEVAQGKAELEGALQTAEAAMNAKSDFLATVSHEIRTPMHSLLGTTSLLGQQSELGPESRQYVQMIRRSGNSLLTVINDVLDLTKIDSGHLELQQETFHLARLLERCFDMVKPQAAEKKLDLACEVDENVPWTLVGDENRLGQVLLNLLGNAVKFTDHGEVLLHVTSLDEGTLQFSVKDTGIGIPKEQIAQLFQRFSQAEGGQKRPGSGLGLAISKKLTELMGGRIWLESDRGQGATFYFTLKCRPGEPEPSDEPVDAALLKDKKVLIVDDNPTSRRIFALQAQRYGSLPYTAAGAKEAINLMRQAGPFDVAAVDSDLPEVDALSLGRALQALAPGWALPVVLIEPGMSPASSERFSAVVTKPVIRQEFLAALARALGAPIKVLLEPRAKAEFDEGFAHRYPLKILVAEDDPANQRVTLAILQKMGYRPEAVSNGRQVLEAVERRRYDLVFMDVNMPELDGLEAAREIVTRWYKDQRPRLVAMTADAMETDRAKCLAAGMDDYIRKPVDLRELRLVLQRTQRRGESEIRPEVVVLAPQRRPAAKILHDFNNVLGVIIGNASLAREDTAPGTPVAEALAEIERAAAKGTELVKEAALPEGSFNGADKTA